MFAHESGTTIGKGPPPVSGGLSAEQVVGFQLLIVDLPCHGRTPETMKIMVNPKHRDKTLGKQLIRCVIRYKSLVLSNITFRLLEKSILMLKTCVCNPTVEISHGPFQLISHQSVICFFG